MRFILNLKSLNKSGPYKKFNIDTISYIFHLLRPNIFLAKFDINDAYYSIPIEESQQKFNFNLKITFISFWPFLMVILNCQENLQNY